MNNIKIFVAVLTLVCICMLSACDTAETHNTEMTPTSNAVSTEASTKPLTEAPTEAPTEPPQGFISLEEGNCYVDENEQLLYQFDDSTVQTMLNLLNEVEWKDSEGKFNPAYFDPRVDKNAYYGFGVTHTYYGDVLVRYYTEFKVLYQGMGHKYVTLSEEQLAILDDILSKGIYKGKAHYWVS